MKTFTGTMFCQTYTRSEGESYDIVDDQYNFMFFHPKPDSEVMEQFRVHHYAKKRSKLQIEYVEKGGFKVPVSMKEVA